MPRPAYTFGSLRDVAQPGSALQWGCRGRRFESGRPDRWKVNSLSALGLWGSFLFLELQYVAPIPWAVIGPISLGLGCRDGRVVGLGRAMGDAAPARGIESAEAEGSVYPDKLSHSAASARPPEHLRVPLHLPGSTLASRRHPRSDPAQGPHLRVPPTTRPAPIPTPKGSLESLSVPHQTSVSCPIESLSS